MQHARLFLFLNLFLLLFSCKKKEHASINWESLSTGTTQTIRAICSFPSNDSLFVCGGTEGVEGIILLSVDGGKNWIQQYSNPQNSFYGLYFKNSKVGFALAEYLDLYATEDGGKNWIRMNRSDTVAFRYRVKLRSMAMRDSSTYFCAGGHNFGSGNLMRSDDKGKNWYTINTYDHELREIYFLNTKHGFACGYGILLETKDGGNSWETQDLGDEFFTGMHFSNEQKGWLCGYNGSLYRSSDEGETWVETLKGNRLLNTSRKHINAIHFFDETNGIIVGEAGYALVTNDGGQNWRIADNPDKQGLHKVVFKNSNEGWAVGDAGNVYHFVLND